MSAQRAKSMVPSDNRSAHPDIPGVPWWGAILIAVGATLAGFAIDAALGHRELTAPFAALYATGCVAAVLAVRQPGVFTAVVQPPLILFVAVPTAYFLFHSSEIHGLKDILINCGYPLIERFLLMFTTSVVVLLIGMARWYFGGAARAGTSTAAKAVTGGLIGGLGAKLSGLLGARSDVDADEPAATPVRERRPRKHGIDRPATASKPPRERRTATGEAPSRSRHARPPMDDPDGAPAPPRRRYARHTRDADAVPDAAPPRRRRPPPPRDPAPRPSRDYRPRDWDAPPPPERPRRYSRTDAGYEPYRPYESYEPYEPPRRREAPPPSTHHPISNVRYRGSSEGDDERYRRPRPRD